MLSKEEILERYIEFLADPENDQDTDSMFAGQNGVPWEVLVEIKAEHPETPQKALDLRRARYALRLKHVDTALFKKAEAGDTKAAELVYRRFESWSPKQADEIREATSGRAKTFSELIAEEDS